MEQIVVVLIVAGVIALLVWNTRKMRSFESVYRFDGTFDGTRHAAELWLANAESKTECVAGADLFALYLLKDPAKPGSMWSFVRYRPAFEYSLKIPWRDIECRWGRVFSGRCVWFDITKQRTSFYMRPDLARRLLAEAGRSDLLPDG